MYDLILKIQDILSLEVPSINELPYQWGLFIYPQKYSISRISIVYC